VADFVDVGSTHVRLDAVTAWRMDGVPVNEMDNGPVLYVWAPGIGIVTALGADATAASRVLAAYTRVREVAA
jgi:hypothetical protein